MLRVAINATIGLPVVIITVMVHVIVVEVWNLFLTVSSMITNTVTGYYGHQYCSEYYHYYCYVYCYYDDTYKFNPSAGCNYSFNHSYNCYGPYVHMCVYIYIYEYMNIEYTYRKRERERERISALDKSVVIKKAWWRLALGVTGDPNLPSIRRLTN